MHRRLLSSGKRQHRVAAGVALTAVTTLFFGGVSGATGSPPPSGVHMTTTQRRERQPTRSQKLGDKARTSRLPRIAVRVVLRPGAQQVTLGGLRLTRPPLVGVQGLLPQVLRRVGPWRRCLPAGSQGDALWGRRNGLQLVLDTALTGSREACSPPSRAVIRVITIQTPSIPLVTDRGTARVGEIYRNLPAPLRVGKGTRFRFPSTWSYTLQPYEDACAPRRAPWTPTTISKSTNLVDFSVGANGRINQISVNLPSPALPDCGGAASLASTTGCPTSSALYAAWRRAPGMYRPHPGARLIGFDVVGCWSQWVIAGTRGQGNGIFVFRRKPRLHAVSSGEFALFSREVCTSPSAPGAWRSPAAGPAVCSSS